MYPKKSIQLFLALALTLMATVASVGDAFASSLPCGGSVTVAAGDTLRKIADRCFTTVSALQLANGISNVNLIYPGQVLVMPGSLLKGSNGYDTYVIARGDTLRSLAAQFGTTIDFLLRLNPTIVNANLIYEGQRLTVPAAGVVDPVPEPPATGGQTYTVQYGDTIRKIADRFGTTIDAVLRLNPQITNPNLIYVGQVINLPAGITSYVVQRGDTLRIIAARFGTTVDALLKLNPNIINANLIYVGQTIKVR